MSERKPVVPIGTPELYGGKTLSEIASLIAHEQAAEMFAYDELSAYGASDMSGLVGEGSQRRQLAILKEAGLTIESFNDLVEERTNGKWAFFGLANAVGRVLRRDYPEL